MPKKFREFIKNHKPSTSVVLIMLSIIGSISSKLIFDREKGTNVNIYTYIINSLSEQSILNILNAKNLINEKLEIESESKDKFDLAYEYIIKNFRLDNNKHLYNCIQKKEDRISITYILDEPYTEYLHQEGISEKDLFILANNIGEMIYAMSKCIEEDLDITVPIEVKVYDFYEQLLIHAIDNQLLELNPIKPSMKLQEL
jgi:hypothetical protein